jgi:hypothetical protein
MVAKLQQVEHVYLAAVIAFEGGKPLRGAGNLCVFNLHAAVSCVPDTGHLFT